MQLVSKYELEITNRQRILMPAGAQILCVQVQRGIPCIWALVNPQAEQYLKTLWVFGTGHEIAVEIGRYVGSFQTEHQSLIFHVFEG